MPFPIFVPFLIKGGIVAAKVLATKGVAAKAAVVTTKAVATFGAPAVISTGTAGLTVVGAYAWSVERIKMAQRAIEFLDKGDMISAANEITRIGRSIFMPTGGELAEVFECWVADGSPMYGENFESLVGHIRQVSDEASITKSEFS